MRADQSRRRRVHRAVAPRGIDDHRICLRRVLAGLTRLPRRESRRAVRRQGRHLSVQRRVQHPQAHRRVHPGRVPTPDGHQPRSILRALPSIPPITETKRERMRLIQQQRRLLGLHAERSGVRHDQERDEHAHQVPGVRVG